MIIVIIFLLLTATLIYFYRREFEVRTIVSKAASGKGPRIGIVSDWHNTGVPFQSRFLAECLSGKHDVYVFAYNKYMKDETDFGYKQLVFTKNIKPWKVINWIKKEGLKAVFFPDRLEEPEVLDWCRSNGVATVMIINYETIKKEEFDNYRKYSVLMCPVRCTYDLLKKYGFRNVRFIRWAVDEGTFAPANIPVKPPIRFIHNAGYGGAQWRKNTLAVVEAFEAACKKNKNIILILKSQKPIGEYPEKIRDIINDNGRIRVIDKDLSLGKLIEFYRSCHVSVLPSKWEGIGIPFIESLSLGLPVITVDAPPMNEWVKDGFNGLTARVRGWEQRKDRKLLVKGALVDAGGLSKKMLKLTDSKLIEKFGRNAVRDTRGMKKRFTREVERLVTSICKK
jgi:glycosyltransferase involved in cell wall biosynthesis